MTNPNPVKPARKSGASRNSKVLSATLAVATGVGVAGMVGVRMAQDASAQDSTATSSATQTQDPGVATSTSGYTIEQLDAYAQALATEATQLQAYRDQLIVIANKSQSNLVTKVKNTAAPKPKAVKPVAAPKVQRQKAAPQTQPQPQPQPQSKSKSS